MLLPSGAEGFEGRLEERVLVPEVHALVAVTGEELHVERRGFAVFIVSLSIARLATPCPFKHQPGEETDERVAVNTISRSEFTCHSGIK